MTGRFIAPFTPASRRTSPAPQPQPTGQEGEEPRDPERMNKADLQKWARELKVSDKGTKAEIAARIRAKV